MRSLRSKFSVVIVTILVLAFSVSGFFLIRQNVSVLTEKLQQDALNFADFSAIPIAENFESSYKMGNFLGFSRFISTSLQRNKDVAKIRIISKENGVLYDSLVEKDQMYQGPSRSLTDSALRPRLIDIKPSFLLSTGETLYLKRGEDGVYVPVNANGAPVTVSLSSVRVDNLVYPLPDSPYSLLFELTYENIDRYIIENVVKMGFLLIGGIAFGILTSLFFVRMITRPVEKLKIGAEKIATGDFDTRVEVETKDEIGVLADTFNHMAADLKKNTAELVIKERMSHEIQLAAEIQRDFIPKKIPQISGIDIAASIVPATEIGGDLYDFIKKGENLMVFIGDVTGHGVPAGLVEGITSSLVFTFTRTHEDAKSSMAEINSVIHEKTRPNVFVTSIMGMFESSTGTFRYANAGHDPVIHFNAKEQKAKLLSKGCLALGMIPDISKLLREENVTLETGDLMVLYTDGIPEAWDQHNNLFGTERFLKLIEQHAHLPSAQNIHDGLIQGVRAHMNGANQADDITLIVIKKL